tara:strand:- start:1144 stop:1278 length:135 start_codon:yes stop_codon:yes gene_type:complete
MADEIDAGQKQVDLESHRQYGKKYPNPGQLRTGFSATFSAKLPL